MAFKLTIPFYAFKLHFHSGGALYIPLTDKDAVRINQPLHLMSGQFADQIQQKVLNKGNFRHLLDEYRQGDFLRDQLLVEFPAAKDGFSYPAFSLQFEYFFSKQKGGIWGIVPSLGLESFATDRVALYKRLEEAVKLEFARNKRLMAVQDIVSTLWFQSIELNMDEISLSAPGLKEVEHISEQKQEALLPQVARKLNLTRQVVYGRQSELDQITKVLKGQFNRNVLLVGPSGVGKTALIWELSRQKKKRKIKGNFWETTASTMIKELMRDTGWQDNLSYLCQELAGTVDLLFIRNLMELFEVGKYEGNPISMADYLRNFISRGEINLISECSEEELARIELISPNYLSFFHVIRLEEPREELESIILRKVKDIARNKKIGISDDAIQEVIRLNRRFTPYSGIPGKPIRFLESILINKGNTLEKTGAKEITRSEVIRYYCEDTGLPLFMVDNSIPMNVLQIKKSFNEKVFGQEAAVERVVDLLAQVKTGLTKSGKPIASFLFVGPTGVGKTELAKILAEFMFGNRQRIVRFDMSEFSTAASVLRLTGANYFSDGLLTSAIRREPFTVLLFDEIEKAHPVFFDLLLQVLSEGRLTDSQGKLVNFCSTIIIMTSNIGASQLSNGRISWQKEQQTTDINAHFISAVQKQFRPELYNRIDQIIPFVSLDTLTVRYVVEREMELFRQREGVKFRRMDLKIAEEVLDYLAVQGYSPRYGARQLQRTVRQELIIPLAKALNHEDFDDQLMVNILIEAGKPKVSVEADPLGLELLLEELDKISFTDHASDQRRQIYQLQEGHLYVRLLSELDIMEQKKKSLKDRFWQNRAQANRYSYYLETKTKVDKLIEEIEGYELELSLACLNLEQYRTTVVDRIKEWEEKFFQLKVEILNRLEPKASTCHLGLYGQDLQPLLEFYLELFKKKDYQLSAYGIWFRERYYNEEILVLSDPNAPEESSTVRKREAYIKKAFDLSDHIIPKAPRTGDKLYGVELSISGPCAYLYLKPEEGIQKWRSEMDEDLLYFVKISNAAFPTPKKIHRQEIYKKNAPRRSWAPPLLKDPNLKINRECTNDKLLPLILEKLEEQFKMTVNKEII